MLLFATASADNSVYENSKIDTENSIQRDLVSVIVSGVNLDDVRSAVMKADGHITTELWLIDSVAATIPRARLSLLRNSPNISSVVSNKRIEASSSMQAIHHSEHTWEIENPIAIDVGANIVHEEVLADGSPITGKGITVAVVDSGVFFEKSIIERNMGKNIVDQFVTQFDFVDDGSCKKTDDGYIQFPSYCQTNEKTSRDRYGHGTHVAGIVWNQVKDANTGVYLGVAPEANIVSIRVLDDSGIGTYEDVVEGIQYVVANKDKLGIRIMNLSLLANATTPYFIDPVNRAAEAAWKHGIVVVAAAGNTGPHAETITVPGNDPYVITVGAFDTKNTPGDWRDDIIPTWSGTGPTLDGFIKPDLLAPGADVVSYMYKRQKRQKKLSSPCSKPS